MDASYSNIDTTTDPQGACETTCSRPTPADSLRQLPPQVMHLGDGEGFDLRISPVRKRIGDAELRMLAYNGSIPGPRLHVDQGSEITVQVTNRRRRRSDGPLARAPAGEPLRRGPTRDAGADPDRRHVHLQGAVPRRRLLLVPPAHA